MAAAVRAMAVSSQVATWRPSCTSSGRHVCGPAAVASGGQVASSVMATSRLEPSSLSVVCATSTVGGARRAGEAARDMRQARAGSECGCSAPAPRFSSSTTVRASVRGFETSLGRRRCAGFIARDRHQRRASPSDPRRRTALVVCMGIRAVESFDATFELIPESKETLHTLLSSDIFCGQVSQQPGVALNGVYRFTEMLFQPVPWSPATKHGMPQEFEKYLHDNENYVIVNVPPNYMFQAKIFKPSRLCAIFQRVGSKLKDAPEPTTDGQQQE